MPYTNALQCSDVELPSQLNLKDNAVLRKESNFKSVKIIALRYFRVNSIFAMNIKLQLEIINN